MAKNKGKSGGKKPALNQSGSKVHKAKQKNSRTKQGGELARLKIAEVNDMFDSMRAALTQPRPKTTETNKSQQVTARIESRPEALCPADVDSALTDFAKL